MELVNATLTPKQARFAYYAARGDMTPGQAALEAGYSSAARSTELLARPEVQRAILKNRLRMDQRMIGTASMEEVMALLRDAADMARFIGDPSAMIRAAREMGLISGHYDRNVVKTVTDENGREVITSIRQMTDEELIEQISRGGNVLEHE